MKKKDKVKVLKNAIYFLVGKLSHVEVPERYVRPEYDVFVELLGEQQRMFFGFYLDEIDRVDWSRVDFKRIIDVKVDLCVDRGKISEYGDGAISAAIVWETMDWTPLRNIRF